jgi:DNA-binding NtrC family response regulator
VLLPLVPAEPRAQTMAERLVPRGSGRVLLVDDEASMVKPVGLMLTKLGYTVTSFSSSPEALRAFHKTPDVFDLVLSDQSMPQMTGEHLAMEILKLRPELPVILMTGYSSVIDRDKAERIGIKALLTKPFPLDVLAREIRRVMEGG